jgi:hypothetical protein
VDERKLADLAKPAGPSTRESAAPAPEPSQPADLSKANEKLASLTGQPKTKK